MHPNIKLHKNILNLFFPMCNCNSEMFVKSADANKKFGRDIIFHPALYLPKFCYEKI